MAKRPVPLYQQVKMYVLSRIQSGEYKPGQRIPSEKALAAETGVSRITSKQALAQLAQEGWLVRVQGKGTFVAERIPPRKPSGTAAVGIVVPHLRDSFVTGIVLGVEAGLVEAGYHLVFRSADRDEEVTSSIRDLLAARVEGLIVWPPPGEVINDEIVRLHLQRFPLVLVDRYLRGLVTDCVQSDHLRGGYLAARHLIETGHRAIAFVTYNETAATSVEERRLGYAAALSEAGIKPLAPWVVPSGSDWTGELLRRLREHPHVTGLFCENDTVALQVIRGLGRGGVKVPDDIAVVGFDGLTHAAEAAVPLTTVRQDAHRIGREAAHLLLQRIRGGSDGVRHVVLPVELVARESTLGWKARDAARAARTS